MTLSIEELNTHNYHDLNRCDNSFTVDSKLVLHLQEGIIGYTIAPVKPYAKQYPHIDIDVESYLAQQDKGIFLAYQERQLAGQIIFSKNWNGYAFLDDLAVDSKFRNKGIGRALIQKAMSWAKGQGLSGLMLETQNVNTGACLFYQRCGFELGGFDRNLYRALEPGTEEIALYWYMIFN